MKTISFLKYTISFFLLFSLILTGASFADCTCTVGGNGIYVVGLELAATGCPVAPPSDDQIYTYLVNPIQCEGTTIRNYSTYGDVTASPRQLIAFYLRNGYSVLRNSSGTHFIMVQKGRYPFSGFVSGVDMSAAAVAVYYATPATSMDQYCTAHPLADQDGDGIPDCLEQAEMLVPYNLGPGCPIPGE